MSATTDAEPRAAPFPPELLASGVSEAAFEGSCPSQSCRQARCTG